MLKSLGQLSFEFFPPKTPESQTQLLTTAALLSNYNPHFFSVTYGAGGSTRDGTIDSVKKLKQQLPIAVAPHLACIGTSELEIKEMLEVYKKLNVKRIVALRGDLPSGMAHPGEFQYAYQLVELIRKHTGRLLHIEVAAYPEVHPQAQHFHHDVLNLKRKFDAGADSAITQYFFNADAFFYFRDECASAGILKPIIPGMMPITQFVNLVRFSDACGAEIPRWIRKRLECYQDDLKSIKAVGTEIIYNLCQQLLQGGVPGLHFYTLNRAEATIKVLDMLGIKTAQREKLISA